MTDRASASLVVTGDEVLVDHEIIFDDHQILDLRPCVDPPDHHLLAPGFVDLQVNGLGDINIALADGDDWSRLDAALIAQGVTSWCPTLISAPLAVLDDRITAVIGAMHRPGPRPEMCGIHLEGPFLGGAHGAHTEVADDRVDLDWIRSLPAEVSIMTLGPECPGAIEAIGLLAAHGVVAALGHTTATFAETGAAIDAGATLFTHAFNASGPFHQREPGAIGAALSDDRLAVSLIADGVHVHEAALRIAWRAKPPGGVVLVSDAAAGSSDGPPRLEDGTLAGSALSIPAAVRFSVDHVGVDLLAAVQAASTNPARLLSLDDRGRLVPGRRADLVALTGALDVVATWVGGVLMTAITE